MEDILVRMGLPAPWVAALELEVLGRLLLAALLGGLVGMERELHGKPAGLRTNLLICVGAALFTELSIDFPLDAARAGVPAVRSDPARVAAQIVTGIGFIGAGTILHSRGRVTGLTSAATIWVVAAIGMGVGARAYVRAAGTTALVLLALGVLRRLEERMRRRRTRRRYRLRMEASPRALAAVETEVRRFGLQTLNQVLDREDEALTLHLDLVGPAPMHDELMRAVALLPGVRRVERER
jgi:putative Mg2+ transporter-C (MgtC) family protein